MRRQGASRNRHDGHVRGLVVVFLPVLRSEEQHAAVRPGEGEILDAGRLLQRRRRARDSAPDLLAVLRARVPRSRHGRSRRAVRAPADAGDGAEGRRRHVEIERERRRSRRDAAAGRRRRAAAVRDVRRAAGKGSGVERCRPRGQLALSGARLAHRRSVVRSRQERRRRSAASMPASFDAGRAEAAPEDPRDDQPRDGRRGAAHPPEHRHFGADGARQRDVRVRRRRAEGVPPCARNPRRRCAKRSKRWSS